MSWIEVDRGVCINTHSITTIEQVVDQDTYEDIGTLVTIGAKSFNSPLPYESFKRMLIRQELQSDEAMKWLRTLGKSATITSP